MRFVVHVIHVIVFSMFSIICQCFFNSPMFVLPQPCFLGYGAQIHRELWQVENQLGIFDGEVVDVPFLKAPGFIKASVVDMMPAGDGPNGT